MINRRDFLSGAAALAASSSFGEQVAGAAQVPGQKNEGTKPNILIFMPDQQQGATVLPEHPCLTPNLDRFSKRGLLFPNAFCPAPHCCPSRATFLTGLYPSEHGVFNNVDTDSAIHPDPSPGIPYFSQSLQDGGYNLGYSGKWHVGHTLRPENVGWTSLNPHPYPVNIPLGADHRSSYWTKAHEQYTHPTARSSGEVKRPGWLDQKLFGVRPGTYENSRDYAAVRDGIKGIERFSREGKQWCVMVSNDGGHDLYNAPQDFIDMYDWRKIELPRNFRDTMEDKPRIYQRMRYQYWQQLSDDEVKQSIAHYYALITMQDTLFGLLLDALEKSGQADNTLVIYCSDHGDYAGAHGLWAKGVPAFREAYNIPCVIRWPKGIQSPGRRVDALVSTADFAPTILEAANVAVPPRMSGMSLMPWFRKQPEPRWRDAIFSQMNGVELYYTQRIVMTKEYKYVYNGFDFDELYDLQADPHETRNLAFPDVAAARASILRGAGEAAGNSAAWPPLPNALDAVRRDMLSRMWEFAQQHNDQIFNNYITVAMAPYGPGIIL
jgi:arylsulfatase A-like enzyme